MLQQQQQQQHTHSVRRQHPPSCIYIKKDLDINIHCDQLLLLHKPIIHKSWGGKGFEITVTRGGGGGGGGVSHVQWNRIEPAPLRRSYQRGLSLHPGA